MPIWPGIYGTAIVPARPYKPHDKAKVEVGVQVVGRWIPARLRHRHFLSLAELNAAIRGLLDELNNRPMRSWAPAGRRFSSSSTNPLRLLPPLAYEYAEWKRCRWVSTTTSRSASIITACRTS
jgi:hypothetical protein